jgi:hypothetical protein
MVSRRHRPTTFRCVALAAISTVAATLGLATTADAACESKGLGHVRGTLCSNSSQGGGSQRQRGAPNYGLGTVKGTERRSSGDLNYDLGNARRPRGWDRRRRLGRGTFKPH